MGSLEPMPVSSDFLPSVKKYTAEIHTRLLMEHLHAVDKLDACIALNQEYAQELRSLRAENVQLCTKLAKRPPE